MKKISVFLVLMLFITGLGLLLNRCASQKEEVVYAGHLPGTQYVGMDQCRSCHQDIHESFIHTGMGASFGAATQEKSSAKFDQHAIVHDAVLDFYYKPFWRDDTLIIAEFRLSKENDTVHYREQAIDYVIGSGHHTNSHLFTVNGYCFQAPITFYTQSEQWDLAPGFENGFSSRFDRIISLECMSCHNGYPDFVDSSENKYRKIALGIDCERCHGPGEVHVREKLAGNIVDTSKYIDHTIINPRDLSKDQVMSLCQRCHLQGITVLQPGKDYYDFIPGMALGSVMDVYLPRFKGEKDQFIMASQADRLRMSACYQQSEMSCISCHNPHKSVKETGKEHFNLSCKNCHQQKKCTVEPSGDCSGCHMPRSGSVDIPHVTITDHYIRKGEQTKPRQLDRKETEALNDYMTLKCMSCLEETDSSRGAAYLLFYEKFQHQNRFLDSAEVYIDQLESIPGLSLRIHLHYLREEFTDIIKLTRNEAAQVDAWTNYRIFEAYEEIGDLRAAEPYLQKAIQLLPLQLEFRHKLADLYVRTQQIDLAIKELFYILNENPKHSLANANMGLLKLRQGDWTSAEQYLTTAYRLDPDHLPTIMALENFYRKQGQTTLAKAFQEIRVNRLQNSKPTSSLP